jgi:hypothetical protein
MYLVSTSDQHLVTVVITALVWTERRGAWKTAAKIEMNFTVRGSEELPVRARPRH